MIKQPKISLSVSNYLNKHLRVKKCELDAPYSQFLEYSVYKLQIFIFFISHKLGLDRQY